ncbi:MAG: hypothetical protein ACH350_00010 [Parachlamydiaceae bacterium]
MEKKSFSINEAIREGWELTKVNIGFLISYQILLFFLIWLFSDTQNGWKLAPVNVIGWLLILLAKMGFYQSALLITKGLKPRFDQFYKNWRLLFTWVIASILFAAMLAIGLSLLIVPGLIIIAMCGFYPFFILDKGVGPIEALQLSAKATKGIRTDVFLLFISCIGLDLLGMLFFGIGILITAPVSLIALTTVYRKITGQEAISIQPSDIIY